uniref:Uncharacterized protein n=1 Tax=Arundo donax TaxID=35708 RepID=A0A0A9HMI2_ARUDO
MPLSTSCFYYSNRYLFVQCDNEQLTELSVNTLIIVAEVSSEEQLLAF